MKKTFFSLVVIALIFGSIMFNMEAMKESSSLNTTLDNLIMKAVSQNENPNPVVKCAQKQTITGDDFDDKANINGRNYTRKCNYTEVSCVGTGSIICQAEFKLGTCTGWKLQQ